MSSLRLSDINRALMLVFFLYLAYISESRSWALALVASVVIYAGYYLFRRLKWDTPAPGVLLEDLSRLVLLAVIAAFCLYVYHSVLSGLFLVIFVVAFIWEFVPYRRKGKSVA